MAFNPVPTMQNCLENRVNFLVQNIQFQLFQFCTAILSRISLLFVLQVINRYEAEHRRQMRYNTFV
jgi:hypothetical protein